MPKRITVLIEYQDDQPIPRFSSRMPVLGGECVGVSFRDEFFQVGDLEEWAPDEPSCSYAECERLLRENVTRLLLVPSEAFSDDLSTATYISNVASLSNPETISQQVSPDDAADGKTATDKKNAEPAV